MEEKEIQTKSVGRPTLYDPAKHPAESYKLCLLGAIDTEMADFFNVHVDTIYEWKEKYPEFSESIKNGKILADANVADKLYQRACGYSHPEVKILSDKGVHTDTVEITKHYPPDTAAAFIWLKNRSGARWKDKTPLVDQSTNIIHNETKVIQIFNAKEVAQQLKELNGEDTIKIAEIVSLSLGIAETPAPAGD